MEKKTTTDTKTRILDAALMTIRSKGLSATSVDDLCRAAGVTKGAFFHHFKSKEDLAVAAADHFARMADGIFSGAPYRQLADPRDRVLAYVDFRIFILQGELPMYTCLLGTMVQEAYDTYPAIREACSRHIAEHAAEVAKDLAEAKRLYAPEADWDPQSLGVYTQTVIQGGFILAKATHGHAAAADALGHLRRYLEILLNYPTVKGKVS